MFVCLGSVIVPMKLHGRCLNDRIVIALLFRHTGLVMCVGMDEGGLHCISGSQDSTAIVWEINAHQDIASLKIVQVIVFP